MKTRESILGGWLCFVTAGCTVLGPMPASTALSPVPNPRPGVEVAAAAVPGYFLSDAVQEDDEFIRAPNAQLSGMIEPGELIDLPGLSIGARYVGGGDGAGYGEPMIRYRRYVDGDERLALAGIVFGTHARESQEEQSYSATRVGAEAMADLRLTPRSKWAELHVGLSVAATGLDAEGRYCLDSEQRYATDCDIGGPPIETSAGGVYPSGTGVLALHSARHLAGVFHGAQLALMGSLGTHPVIEYGEQASANFYGSIGLGLTLGFGAVE
ncbi:MAG TPA: hypothetical protein VK524_24655 [Polyangiaceae bacterium]|nr:hypothetical protein [Polyangiaceae bacterium]